MDLDYLVMKHHPIFEKIVFKLNWIDDTEMANLLYNRYYFEDCVYHTEEFMTQAIQNKADLIADRYNALYTTTMLEYDPLYNFHMIETGKSTSTGSSNSEANNNSLASEYPMNVVGERPVSKGTSGSTGKSSSNGTVNQTIEKKGQIGFSAQDLIEKERKLIISLKERYTAEFTDLFALVNC